MSDLLKRVFIRAQVNNKWESISLQELLDLKEGTKIWEWFAGRMGNAVGLKEGNILEEKHVENMVHLLDAIGSTIYKIKPEVTDERKEN